MFRKSFVPCWATNCRQNQDCGAERGIGRTNKMAIPYLPAEQTILEEVHLVNNVKSTGFSDFSTGGTLFCVAMEDVQAGLTLEKEF
jgi:hypothetical protein